MSSNSDAGITLVARTDEFNARLNKAVGTFETLASKGRDVGSSLDKSFKKISLVAKDSVFQIEKSFNSLNIKSDLSLEVQAKALQQNVKFFELQYKKIATDANTSAAEATRAFVAMNDKIRLLNEQPLKNAFSTLNVLPTTSIEASKAKIIAAFNQIKTSGTASANDVQRAYRAMNIELDKLKQLGSTNPTEKVTKGFNAMSFASVAAIAKIQILYSLINTTMSLIGSIPSVAIDAVESFNSSAISNAALITSMQKGVTDIGEAYKQNKIYAESVQEVLIKMDAQTAASGKNLTDMNRKFAQQGVLIDANNEKQVKGFLNISNALAALTAGDSNANLQYPQEISAMLRAEDRPSNKLFQTLNSLDNGKLKEHLEQWQKIAQETGNYGYVLEQIGPLLAGFDAAQEDINLLWETQKSTLITIRDEIFREGFEPSYDLLILKTKSMNEFLYENKEILSESLNLILQLLIKTENLGASVISGGIKAVTTVNDTLFIKPGKYVADRLQETLEYFDLVEKRSTELNKSFSAPDQSKFGGKYEAKVNVPTGIKIGTEGETDKEKSAREKAERAVEKQLRLETNLREKTAALAKSYNEIILSDNENARKLDLQNNEIAYSEKIISLSKYIKKKQDIEIASAKEEIQVNRDNVAEYQAVLEGKFQSGTKGLIDKADATIKLNKANQQLKDSESALALLLSKNAAELSKYSREEIDYIKTRKIAYSNQIGDFVKAEQLRQSTISYTNELLRLQQDAVEGIVGAQEALADFKYQGSVDIKLATNKQKFQEDDTNNSKFGSDNQFDSITNKYEEMYRNISNIEAQYGKQSIELQNAKWGASVDMATDSMNTITNVLMQGNESQFNAGKALAMSMAIINGALAVSKALTLSYPMNFVVAGLVGAAVGIEIGTIASQQYEGRALGGYVEAGQTYIVNENRKTEGPEYFTPGVNGVITPAGKMKDEESNKKVTNIVNQSIHVQGIVNRRTSNQMANDSARKQRVASARFG